MTNKEKLVNINNEIKDYLNQSKFISLKHRNKIIEMLGNEFSIKFKLDNYENIDVTILDNGHIIMYGDEYAADEDYSFSEIEERYHNFKEKADIYLARNDHFSDKAKNRKDILNIIVLLLLFLLCIFLIDIFIESLISKDFFNCIWLVVVAGSWLIPSIGDNIKQRIEMAKRFIKRKKK